MINNNIHYHGGPMWGRVEISPGKFIACKEVLYKKSCALVSFARMDQFKYVIDTARSVKLDNGAFSDWRKNGENRPMSHWAKFYAVVLAYYSRIDNFFIPDVIEGTEEQNDELIKLLPMSIRDKGIPVWHSVESLERLERLCNEWDIVALGFCGDHQVIWSDIAQERMMEVFSFIYIEKRINVKIHGLRMLDGRVLGKFPFHSADSAFVSVNVPKTKQQMPEVQCKLARTAIYKRKIECVTPPTVGRWLYNNNAFWPWE